MLLGLRRRRFSVLVSFRSFPLFFRFRQVSQFSLVSVVLDRSFGFTGSHLFFVGFRSFHRVLFICHLAQFSMVVVGFRFLILFILAASVVFVSLIKIAWVFGCSRFSLVFHGLLSCSSWLSDCILLSVNNLWL